MKDGYSLIPLKLYFKIISNKKEAEAIIQQKFEQNEEIIDNIKMSTVEIHLYLYQYYKQFSLSMYKHYLLKIHLFSNPAHLAILYI